MNALTRRFWWKLKNLNGRYLAWRARDKLCQQKSKGSLGFKKSKAMNKALVSKLAWMVVSKRNNFCMSVLKCKYKSNCIIPAKFFRLFYTNNLLFLFNKITFTKHRH